MSAARKGLIGLALGVAGGVAAALLLSPEKRQRPLAAAAAVAPGPARNLLQKVAGGETGLLPDERITSQIRARMDERGLSSSRVDVTTVDGVVYLRGREPDGVQADYIVAAAYDVPGVVDVIDEVKREA